MDVTATRKISASPARVAAIMFDPTRDPEWIGGAKSVDPPTGNPTVIGARTTRHGGFMGRKFSWQTEVVEFEPNSLLDMRFVAGPMKGGSAATETPGPSPRFQPAEGVATSRARDRTRTSSNMPR